MSGGPLSVTMMAVSPGAGKTRYQLLFLTLIALVLTGPFFGRSLAGRVAVDILFTTVLAAGLWSVVRSGLFFVLATAIAAIAFLTRWAAYAVGGPLSILAVVLTAMFLPIVAVSIIADVMRDEHVTLEHISGAAAVYLLLGLFWALLYLALHIIHPGSLSGAGLMDETGRPVTNAFIYFSFVTLATLGYGDIVPVTPEARALAITEAVIGQLYVVVLIARLVAQHSTSRPSKGSR